MSDHFEHYFPGQTYRPLDLMSSAISTPDDGIVIKRVRYNQYNDVLAYKCLTISKAFEYTSFTADENTLCASITVPLHHVAELVKRCNDSSDDVVTALCGPCHAVFVNDGDDSILKQDFYVRLRVAPMTREMIDELNAELLDCQKKMVTRLYFKPNFNNFAFAREKYRDVPIGVVLEYANFLRYNSVIVPYGVFFDTVAAVSHTGPNFKIVNNTAKLYGPCLISDTTTQIFYPQSSIHSLFDISKSDLLQYENIPMGNIDKHIADVFGKPLARLSHPAVRPKTRVAHFMHKKLQPYFDLGILIGYFGDDNTARIKEDVGFDIQKIPDLVERLTLFWLLESHGDYRYIAPLLNNPLYAQQCKQAVSKYCSRRQLI